MTANVRFFPFRFSHNDRARALSLLRPQSKSQLAADDSTPIDQQLADAFNSNNAVMAYVLGLTNTNLPTMTPEPDWYAAFATQLSNAKTTALEWQNGITPNLISIPQNIVNYAMIFSANMITINQAVAILQSDPTNPQAMSAITNSLAGLLTATNSQSTAAQTTQGQISAFATSLVSDASAMATAIQNAMTTVGVDQAQIAMLQADINALQDEIATFQVVVTASAIAAGVSLFAGAVLAIFSFGVGLAIGIIGFAAGLTTALVANHEIQVDTAKVQADMLSMSDLNQQITALTVLQSNLTTLIQLSNAAGTQVQLLMDAWSQLESEITAVITDLNSAETDINNLTALQADLNRANADWQTLQAYASTMAGIQYNTATPPTATLQPSSTAAAA
jgi:hypothetical protein